MLTLEAPVALSIIIPGQASLQHYTLHSTDVLMRRAKMKGIRLFMLTCDAWQQRTGRPKSCHTAVIPYLPVKALAAASAPLGWAQAHHWLWCLYSRGPPSQGLESVHTVMVQWNWNLMLHSTFYTLLLCLQSQMWTNVLRTLVKGRAGA